MALSYELSDRRGDTLLAQCTGVLDEPNVWHVEFWGPNGPRHVEPRMHIDPNATHKQVLQDFVTQHELTATINPKGFTGEFDGYSYAGSWGRVDTHKMHWSARVRGPSGMLCGTPGGKLHHGDESDEQLENAARMATEISIRDSIQVERESDD